MTRTAILVLLLAAGCGSSEPAPGPTTPAAAEPPAGHEGKDDHHRLTPELDAFHELLSPLWHAPAGEPRRKDTCAAVPDFKTRAAAVKAAAAPAQADPAGWSSAGAELEASVASLATACGGTDVAAFDSAFEAVHTRFHHAMELAGGEHGRGHKEGDH